MIDSLESIKDILTLERIEENIFRGQSQNIGTPQVYGGQVLGQAIAAAQLTVDARPVHSVHAYFLRKGDFNSPIIYEVDRNREGRSFTARRVVAIQHGQPIFTLAASFQVEEAGLDYQEPVALPDIGDTIEISSVKRDPARRDGKIRPTHFFDLRFQTAEGRQDADALSFWVKAKHPLPDEADLHREVLAYVSDFGLLYSALVPHGYNPLSKDSPMRDFALASIDHAIWFHRPFKADEWLYYHCDPVSTSGARGLARGSFVDAEGRLVASTIQEGLMRHLGK